MMMYVVLVKVLLLTAHTVAAYDCHTEAATCNARGSCTDQGTCLCDEKYFGDACDQSTKSEQIYALL